MFRVTDNQDYCSVKVEAISSTVAFERSPRTCAPAIPGVDVIRGCPAGCLFCPHRWRGLEPGRFQVKVDLPSILESELASRKRSGTFPDSVVFNAFSDAFPKNAPALVLCHETLKILLENDIKVYLRTREVVPEGFKDLFKKHSSKISVDVSFFSMDEQLSKLYEPCASHPQQRLDTIRTLLSWGVDVRARIEPLIPFVNDTAGHMEELVRHVRSAGARRAVSSYLFLTKGMMDNFEQKLPVAHFRLIKGSFRRRPWQQVGIHQMLKFLPAKIRTEGYERLGKIAKESDLSLHICKCSDPALGQPCFDKLVKSSDNGSKKGQLSLFDMAG